jgi:acyl carrier protein
MVIQQVSRRDTAAIGRDDDLVEALGVDSLEGLQILAGVEKRCDVRLPDDELIHMRTIARIADTVERLQQGGAS